MPNGLNAKVTHIGTITLLPSLVLEKVLLVPSFSFNLISVSKLLQNKKHFLTCFHDHCAIQVLSSQMTFGLAKRVNGLYHIQRLSSVSSVSPSLSVPCNSFFKFVCTVSSTTWHYRLGHHSHDRLKLIKTMLPDLPLSDCSTCIVCHKAK